MALVTLAVCALVVATPSRESGTLPSIATPDTTNLTEVLSAPTATPARDTAENPTPIPLPADGVPLQASIATEFDQAPEGFPPLSAYTTSLRPGFHDILTDLAHLPRYEISAEILPARRLLEGNAAIAIFNSSESTWSSIVFRLAANNPRLITDMHVVSVVVEGLPVQPVLSSSETVLTIPLATPLETGHWIQVELVWHVHYTQLTNERAYVRNGANLDMINLPHFYPELAVFAPGAPGTNAQGWWIQEIPPYTDIRFHDSALMRVTATVPEEYVLVGSGTPVRKEPVADGRIRQHWVTGPVRGFVLQASPKYLAASKDVDGIQIQTFYHAEDESVALRVLDETAQALDFFSEIWSPYPYTHLTLVSSPLGDTAMEYSNLIQVGIMRYRDHPWDTAFLMTHEVAHQWIYLLVHNDPVHHAGLDEGLAELSYVYMKDTVDAAFEGPQFIAYWRHLNENFGSTFEGDGLWWLAHPYQNLDHYHATHYRRPAVLLGEMWSAIGNEEFTDLLQNYIAQHQFQIVTPDNLIGVLQDAGQNDRLADLEQSLRKSAAAPP